MQLPGGSLLCGGNAEVDDGTVKELQDLPGRCGCQAVIGSISYPLRGLSSRWQKLIQVLVPYASSDLQVNQLKAMLDHRRSAQLPRHCICLTQDS